jgi:putative transposase
MENKPTKEYILKTYSFPLYPNDTQEQKLRRSFGTARYIYNYGLEVKKEVYEKCKKSVSYIELARILTFIRETLDWMRECSSVIQQQSLRHLDAAYQNFYRGLKQGDKPGFPEFKSKHGRQAISYPVNVKVDFDSRKIHIPKIGELSYRNNRDFSGEIRTTTVVRSTTGKYYAQVLVQTNTPVPKPKKITPSKTMGIDVGLKNFAIFSDGTVIQNPKFFREFEKKLQRVSRWFSRTKKGSNNRNKSRRRLAVVYEKSRNNRSNFLHQLTSRIVNDNQINCICLEDLNVAGMGRNHNLSKSVHDAAFSEFKRQLQYKSNWLGKSVILIDRWAPSSKMCHNCGSINEELTLNQREWDCSACGIHLDRDLNAALNIKEIGLKKFAETQQDTHGKCGINASGEASLVRSLVERGRAETVNV